jgi:protein SCO1/2
VTRPAIRLLLALVVLLPAFRCISAAQQPQARSPKPEQYTVRGMVVRVDPGAKTFVASIEAIPNFMSAMTMPFEVRNVGQLEGLGPGALVEFTLVVDGRRPFATSVRVVPYQSVEQDPFTASRLTVLGEIVGSPSVAPLPIGALVPEFTLIDQTRRPLPLSELRGKVVAVNFIYTSCALPNFCLRLANNFNVLQKRFRQRLGRDLVLLTVTFDPVHDTPDVLATYAAQWGADSSTWKFLTGGTSDVRRVCQLFGVHAYANEGLMDHTLHTVLIDRGGTLVANVEGNQFSPTQLGDLVDSLLGR